MIQPTATPLIDGRSATVDVAGLPHRAGTLLRNAPQRLRERPFWIIQVGVLAVTLVHLLSELWASELGAGVHPALHHVPVILYLGPIAYATLRYGIEGAFLTGLWCAALTLPNIVAFHPQDLEWLTELVYVGVVIAAGVTMAVPVERERRQRQRAETTSRRLQLLNEIATLTLTADLDRTLNDALESLVAVLDLDAACLAAGDRDDPARLSPLVRQPPTPRNDHDLEVCLAGIDLAADSDRVHTLADGVLAVPFDIDLPDPSPAGRVSGVLAARPAVHRLLSADDHRLLVSVSNQLALALANARLKELERDRVHSYARQVTWAQEEERKRISRELHDEAAQNLVAIRRGLDTLAVTLDHEVESRELLELEQLTSHTLAGLRRFSRDLRPPVLDDLGLPSALDALIEDLGSRGSLELDLTVTGTPRRLSTDVELVLFRIAQAALHNIERHAGATRASVDVTFELDRVRLVVADDGSGFHPPADVAELAASGKLGLLGMHERAQLVGARLQISSAPGRGTRVVVDVVG